jgi:RNA polymerase sigma factor (sigma-70 family)
VDYAAAKLMDEWIPTRASLIRRLGDWQDHASWQVFFDTYWKVLRNFALKSGLNEAEAMDAAQETLISVARHMPNFKYDPVLGSFKSWLLNMAQWRINDQLRKRRHSARHRSSSQGTGTGTDTVARVPAPSPEDLWDAEWEQNLLDAAIANVRRHIDPRAYQMFDLQVNKRWAPARVAATFGVTVGLVYVAKHRVTESIKQEFKRLEKERV